MALPKSFKLGRITYDIKYVDNATHEDVQEGGFLFGVTDMVKQEIQISTKDKEGNDLKEERIKGVLFHEISHSILDELADNETTVDEIYVEALGGKLQDLFETLK